MVLRKDTKNPDRRRWVTKPIKIKADKMKAGKIRAGTKQVCQFSLFISPAAIVCCCFCLFFFAFLFFLIFFLIFFISKTNSSKQPNTQLKDLHSHHPLLGESDRVVNSLDFCPASLKSLGCFYFWCVLSSQWKSVTVNLRILHCQL